MIEKWRSCPGFPFYEVSNLGRVRSLPRVVHTVRNGGPFTHTIKGQLLKVSPSKTTGYPMASLYREGGPRTPIPRLVHRLVCEAFHGLPPPGKPTVAHKDGTRTNNREDNLRWASHSEQRFDQLDHGTMLEGDNHYKSILTDEQVREIRERYVQGDPINGAAAMAREFGIKYPTMKKITAGMNRKHA